MSAAALHGQFNELANYIYGPAAVCAHVLFGSVLYLVFTGNKRPGLRLMSLTFAALSFSVFWVAQDPLVPVTAIAFLVLFFCAGYDVVHQMTNWGLGKARPLCIRRTAWFALAWAWFYPQHVAWWKIPLASPLGVLPSPTLLAMIAMLWLAFPQTNRLLHWPVAVLGVLYALFGIIFVHVFSDVVLLAVSGLSLRELIKAAREAGGLLEDDLTPKEQPRAQPERTKKDQVWKI